MREALASGRSRHISFRDKGGLVPRKTKQGQKDPKSSEEMNILVGRQKPDR